MNAYADWWLARARGLEQRDEAPVRELEDAELRELTASLRELSEGSSILLVIQLREAAWELQEELNRRTDLQSATDEQAARGEPSALGSPAAL